MAKEALRATVTIVCDVPNVQALTALRQRCHDYVAEDYPVIASNSGFDAKPFTVFGSIKGRPEESWRQVYLAENPADAEAQAIKEDPKRTVVAVLAGDVPAAVAG